MVYKLLRFHRHHAQNSSDLDLLTSIGSKLLHKDKGEIMNTLQRVAARKTKAANPCVILHFIKFYLNSILNH